VIARNQPLYQTRAAGTRLLRVFLLVSCILVLALIIVGILIQPNQLVIWLTVAASSLMPVLLVWLVVPEGFEVWPDRLRLVFPLFGWDLRIDTIESVQPARWWQSYAFRGIRFATAPTGSVVILRREPRLLGRPNIVISPANRDELLTALSDALKNARQ
jgi:hypothetical protein